MNPNLLMTIYRWPMIVGRWPTLVVFCCSFAGQRPSAIGHRYTSLTNQHAPITNVQNPYVSIEAIPLPAGYSRIPAEKNSFVIWLRNTRLKKDKTVYTYTGMPKANQHAQFAVLDISVGNKDLQQCADAVMRLRAEYLYAQKRFSEINFRDNNNTNYTLGTLTDRAHFNVYLDKVFSRCGSLSLQKQLDEVKDINHLQPGDVLIQGGSPGHAMMVTDMAANAAGKKIYLLAQSYMPAQDIHIVLNPVNDKLSPWYELNNNTIFTPEWVFPKGHFKTWPGEGH